MKARHRIVVLAVVAGSLVACDPYPVPRQTDHADLYIDFNSTGGANVMLMLGGTMLTSTQLVDDGHAIAPVLFNAHGSQTVHINKQGQSGGSPFIQIDAKDVYAAGAHPVVQVDTTAALSLLGGMGYRSVYVEVSAPGLSDTATWRSPPDTTQRGNWSWNAVVPGQAAPAGVITVIPPPASHASHASRDFAQFGWVAGSLVCVTAAGFLLTALVTRRRRQRPMAGGPTG